MALAAILFARPVAAVDLVRIATIPRGESQWGDGLPIGDADHDGRNEVYFEQSVPPFSLNGWEGWGSSSLQPVMHYQGCHPAAVGDPDQDGLTDALCQWGGLAFLLESETPTTFPSRIVWGEPLGGFPGINGYFHDADQDGRQEMWIVRGDTEVIEVWENRGNDSYEIVTVLGQPNLNPGTLAFGDFDGDGATEIVVGGALNSLFLWEATGDDLYTFTWTFGFADTFVLVVTSALDLDGDQKSEFLVGGETLASDHRVSVFEARGNNTYEPVWEAVGDGSQVFTYVVVGDVDGDGLEEFAAAVPGAIQLYEAVGDNDFSLIGQVPFRDTNNAIDLADLNGNGVDELIFNGDFDLDGPIRIDLYELADIQPPVLIPSWYPSSYQAPPGGLLAVQLELFNRTDLVQPQDLWLEVYQGRGEGGPQGPLLRQKLLRSQAPLPSRQTVGRELTLRVPPQSGEYTYQVKAGTFPAQVTDTRWFTIVAGP